MTRPANSNAPASITPAATVEQGIISNDPTDRGLCAVCLRSVAVCDGKTCQYDPSTAEVLPVAGQTPTARQLAFVIELLDTCEPLLSANNPIHEESDEAAEAVLAWLRALVPPELIEQVLGEIDACRVCRAPLKNINGNMACPVHGEPASSVATTTVATAEIHGGRARAAASIAAKAAARDAIAAGADPLVVVDAALPVIAHLRELVGQSAKYVAQDPLAALVVELRHKRVPSQFARTVRGLAVAADADCGALHNYDDGHERREGDSSVSEHIDLIDLAAFEGTRDELADKAIDWAQHFAGRLVGWREQIADSAEADDSQGLRSAQTLAEIERAADAFIAGLTKAGAP